MARKRKNGRDQRIACQYKHFHSPKKKNGKQSQVQQSKRYFEHDTRTAATIDNSSSGGGGGGGAVKRIKFNNEINIYGSNETRTISSAAVNVSVKKRSKKKSTKQLQKQLIETQKRLQRQLIRLQQHQHNSFLTLLCRTECNHRHNDDSSTSQQHTHPHQCTTANCKVNHLPSMNGCPHRSSHECINPTYDSNSSTSSLSNKKFTTDKMANGCNR